MPFDDHPTPDMENVQLKALGKGSRPHIHSAYLPIYSAVAEQSMVSEDLVEPLGLSP